MDKKSETDKKCREAARAALERTFAHSDPMDNIAQARGIVAYLKTTKFSDEAPDAEAMYGYWLILTLLDILLEQADRRVELDSLGGKPAPENLSVE